MTHPATQFWCLVSAFGSNFQWQYVAAVFNATFLIRPYSIKSEKNVATKPFLDQDNLWEFIPIEVLM